MRIPLILLSLLLSATKSLSMDLSPIERSFFSRPVQLYDNSKRCLGLVKARMDRNETLGFAENTRVYKALDAITNLQETMGETEDQAWADINLFVDEYKGRWRFNYVTTGNESDAAIADDKEVCAKILTELIEKWQ